MRPRFFGGWRSYRTGAYKRSLLLPELRDEQQRQKKTGNAYSLFLFDLDLKEINNKLGPGVGDKVLHAAILNLRKALTAKDLIYRVVGAEFVICLPGKSNSDVELMKGSILKRIGEAVSIITNMSKQKFSVNYSIIAITQNSQIEELLDHATRMTFAINI